MTEMIRRLKLSDLSECKAHAKHERIRNDKRVDTFSEIGDSSGSDDVSALDTLSRHCSFAPTHDPTTGELVVR